MEKTESRKMRKLEMPQGVNPVTYFIHVTAKTFPGKTSQGWMTKNKHTHGYIFWNDHQINDAVYEAYP